MSLVDMVAAELDSARRELDGYRYARDAQAPGVAGWDDVDRRDDDAALRGDDEAGPYAIQRARQRALAADMRATRDRIRSLRIEMAEARRALRHPVGLTEIARELGCPLNTAQAWAKRRRLPKPRGTVSGQPWWWRHEIIEWARLTNRDRNTPEGY